LWCFSSEEGDSQCGVGDRFLTSNLEIKIIRFTAGKMCIFSFIKTTIYIYTFTRNCYPIKANRIAATNHAPN